MISVHDQVWSQVSNRFGFQFYSKVSEQIENQVLSSIEMYDNSQWKMLTTTLQRVRNACAAVCLDSKLVVLGGLGNESIEVYDPATRTITSDLIPKMQTNSMRSCLASVSF